MAVDWLRSCYQSEWRLFRDNAENITKGEYYFSPDDAPFYAGNHFLWSRTWHDRNHPVITTLGETEEATHVWQEGDAPAYEVLSRAIGSSDCIALGEDEQNGLADDELIDGFSPGCIITRSELDTLWRELSEFDTCSVQRLYISLIVMLYGNDDEAITRTLQDWLGLAPVVRIRHHQGTLNGVITVRSSQWFIAILDGTSNFQEFALQAFSFVVGPTNFGIYSTADLWYASSTRILDYMAEDGFTANHKLMLAGHSYGGCVAYNIAARMRFAHPQMPISYVTYGAPKIGDQRFVTLIDACSGRSIINDDDLISVLPPDRASLTAILPVLATPSLLVYTEWLRSRPQAELSRSGSLDFNGAPILDFVTLFNLVITVLAQEVIDPIEGHLSTEYLCRLQRRCPAPEWPIDEKVSFDILCGCNTLGLVEQNLVVSRGINLRHPDSIINDTCLSATTLALNGTPIPGSILQSAADQGNWYKIPILIGQTYFFRMDSAFFSGLAMTNMFGVSCAGMSPGEDHIGTHICFSFIATYTGFKWVKVHLDVFPSATYTVSAGTGTC